jgi:hypothetical protein
MQDIEKEGAALKLHLEVSDDDDEDDEQDAATAAATAINGERAAPAKIHIVETVVVKPRKPSLVHINTLDVPDLALKAQRRWVLLRGLQRDVVCLYLLTNSALLIRVQMRGEGGSCGVSANEYSCAHHVTWSPNKL